MEAKNQIPVEDVISLQNSEGEYIGPTKDGNWHGSGQLVLESKSVYEGEWVDGQLNFLGKLYCADSRVFDCFWEDGQLKSSSLYIPSQQSSSYPDEQQTPSESLTFSLSQNQSDSQPKTYEKP